ncbi:MAG: hypothetical protein HUJ60_06860 [Bacilli bacterium]|nr:hypothetical protein [Bacilli bacterium]
MGKIELEIRFIMVWRDAGHEFCWGCGWKYISKCLVIHHKAKPKEEKENATKTRDFPKEKGHG